MANELSRYRAVVEPVYSDLKNCFAQVAGSMLLAMPDASGSSRHESTCCQDAQPQLDRIIRELRAVNPPSPQKNAHAMLLESAVALDDLIIAITSSALTSSRLSESVAADLQRAFRMFRRGSIPELRLLPVDLSSGCCGRADVTAACHTARRASCYRSLEYQ